MRAVVVVSVLSCGALDKKKMVAIRIEAGMGGAETIGGEVGRKERDAEFPTDGDFKQGIGNAKVVEETRLMQWSASEWRQGRGEGTTELGWSRCNNQREKMSLLVIEGELVLGVRILTVYGG